MHKGSSRRSGKPHRPPKVDFTQLPDDRPDLDKVFLSVDVNNAAPPGTDADEASWVVRYGAS